MKMFVAFQTIDLINYKLQYAYIHTILCVGECVVYKIYLYLINAGFP